MNGVPLDNGARLYCSHEIHTGRQHEEVLRIFRENVKVTAMWASIFLSPGNADVYNYWLHNINTEDCSGHELHKPRTT